VGLCSGVPEVSTLQGYDASSMGDWFPTFWNNVVLSSRFNVPEKLSLDISTLENETITMSGIDGNTLPRDAAS
jgi:hypothetical protein